MALMQHARAAWWPDAARLRQARLSAGLVLFVFVTTHLLNHALGIVSLQAMEAGRSWFLAVWRHPIGTVVLVGALVLHIVLVLWSIFLRRHLRMPWWQALQLVLGLCIPLVLVNHAVNTRLASLLYGYQDSYTMLVLLFWKLRPELGIWQSVLLLVAWTHGCMGIHYWLRMRHWYPRVAMVLYTGAILLPVLALLGFAQAGRYVALQARDPGWLQQVVADARVPEAAALASLADIRDAVLATLAVMLVLTFAARAVRRLHESGRSIRIRYPGGQVVAVPRGFSVLESSRHAGIAHTSVCGGRGRCSTCRVRVRAAPGALPEPDIHERRVLARVAAPDDVRLACQLRPLSDIHVTPLVPPSLAPSLSLVRGQVMAGEERELCVLFADLRGFTALSEHRLPYDVVFLLNRYFEAVGDAIERAGGTVNQFTGDGVMALFGLQSGARAGARQALQAAVAMNAALAALSAELHEELQQPLKLGIGIHCGASVVGHMGRGDATYLTAVGDTVNTASRLQDETKRLGCQLVVSAAVAQYAGIDGAAFRHQHVTVRNRAEPIATLAIDDVRDLDLPPAGN